MKIFFSLEEIIFSLDLFNQMTSDFFKMSFGVCYSGSATIILILNIHVQLSLKNKKTRRKEQLGNNSKIPASRVVVLRWQEIEILKCKSSLEVHRETPALLVFAEH